MHPSRRVGIFSLKISRGDRVIGTVRPTNDRDVNPNPFEVSDSRQHGVADVHARDTPIVYKPTFILLWFIGNVALSLSYFFIINAIDPCMSIDLPFYRNLYAAIGAMSAVLSLFIGHLVVARRLSVQSVILLLTLPYLFVVFVAAGLGHPSRYSLHCCLDRWLLLPTEFDLIRSHPRTERRTIRCTERRSCAL